MDFIYEKNRIYVEDVSGKVIALVTFSDVSDHIVNINHTFVDESLREKGMAAKMMEAVARKLRKEEKKACATCSYAVKWFVQNPDFADVYLPSL